MRRKAALTLALALLLTGCGGKEQPGEVKPGECRVWFVSPRTGTDSAVVTSEVRTPEGKEPLELLMAGPESAELVSPFPAGTRVRESRTDGGICYVDLSEAYGALSGVELTLADACIVLTLCESEEVEQVYITVEGEERPYRDQMFSPEDFLLENGRLKG